VKAEGRGAKNHTSRRRVENRNKGRRQQSTAIEFFRGVGFSIHMEGPVLYLRQ